LTYTGFGVYQQAPPPKKNRQPLWIALGVLAGVLVIGGTVTTIVVSNAKSTATTQPTASSTPPDDANWLVVDNTAAKVVYRVPESWEPVSGTSTVGGAALSKFTESRPFQCQGRNMIQANAGSGTAKGNDAESVATAVASAVATGSYAADGKAPTLAKPVVKQVDIAGAPGVSVTVVATPTAVSPCYAPNGEITAIAYPSDTGTAVVVLNVAKGGPHVAEGPTDDEVTRILESVRPS
jgi:hypothetical protein